MSRQDQEHKARVQRMRELAAAGDLVSRADHTSLWDSDAAKVCLYEDECRAAERYHHQRTIDNLPYDRDPEDIAQVQVAFGMYNPNSRSWLERLLGL